MTSAVVILREYPSSSPIYGSGCECCAWLIIIIYSGYPLHRSVFQWSPAKIMYNTVTIQYNAMCFKSCIIILDWNPVEVFWGSVGWYISWSIVVNNMLSSLVVWVLCVITLYCCQYCSSRFVRSKVIAFLFAFSQTFIDTPIGSNHLLYEISGYWF